MKKKLLAGLATGLFLTSMVCVASATTISEIESNDTLATAQNLDNYFSIGSNADIYNSNTNPWVSVQSTGNGSFDYFSFTVDAGVTGWFDIDYGIYSGGSVDTEIALWDSNGNVLEQRDDNSDYQSYLDPGTVSSLDPSISYQFASAGTYIVGVGEFNSQAIQDGWSGNMLDTGDTYTLQVTLSSHEVPTPTPEPATMLLFGTGLAGLVGTKLRRKKK